LDAAYDEYLSGLKVYGRTLTEEEKLILRVTRLFGECELIVPREYLDEVTRYIRRWQSTPRFMRGIRLAQDRGYVRTIAEEFISQNLPPQFFYLALQESDFNPLASGPPTRFGYAKGMWQFIPSTGRQYGLAIGPLEKVPQPDPADERFDWAKATRAATRYIKDIYATDAQASGLLVMASYNWGERRVVERLREMPKHPRERNFWKLLERHRIPAETYTYVFSIVSAAVIGENPRMFGFPIDNPLTSVTAQPAPPEAAETAQRLDASGR
jgi:membrane-bound lytic murein transglycosylase D